MSSKNSNTGVHLGFALDLQPHELYSLRRQFLPLGKVGGMPAWLNPANLPSAEDLSCGVCNKPLAFLLQVYCTSSQSPSHAFHRSLFVFVCRDSKCSKTNEALNFAVFRCQLPRHNAYYGVDSALDPWTAGDVPDPYFNEASFEKLCRLCGCRATKKCAKCLQQWYCSREHQVIDWSAGGHKLRCGTTEPNQLNQSDSLTATNPFLFKEFGIEMELEYGHEDDIMDHDHHTVINDIDSSDDESADSAQELAEQIKELRKFENVNCEMSASDLEEIKEKAQDSLYKVFSSTVSANPTQILRYIKGGIPLLATDHSPRPLDGVDVLNIKPIPNCALCGAPRQFEMQLMPYLLSIMEVDQLDNSIDWATLLLYTCSRDCTISNDGYAREFAFKQDFVENGELSDAGQSKKN